ncbi:MAG: C-GCAxxG-C-C family protein [Promethearchaeota archaeon]
MLKEVELYWAREGNCAQSSAAGLLDYFVIEKQAQQFYDAFYPYGGGFKEGDVCGVVSGSLAALSFILSKNKIDSEKIYELSAEFRRLFHKSFKSIRCYGLTEEFRDEDNQTVPIHENEQRARCDAAMKFATNTVLKLINQ